jgi:hypothetical protein
MDLVRVLRTGMALAVVALVAMLAYAKALPCIFAKVFRVPCPGCGSTRAVLALLRGDLHDVVRHNPFGPLVAVLLACFAVEVIASVAHHGDLREAGKGPIGRVVSRLFVVVAVLQTVFWVARFFGAFGGPVPV